jgi:DNA-binding MurR/RpiR family transcriptional regulator
VSSTRATNGDAEPVDVAALIRLRLTQLSPNDRRIADWLLAHTDEASFETAESLAGKAGVSKAAVIRFGARLGLGGYAGLHAALASSARRRLAEPEPLATAAAGESVADRWLAATVRALAATRTTLPDAQLDEIATLLTSQPGSTYLFGQRTSAALAEYAFLLLNPRVPSLRLIEAGRGTVGDLLLGVGPRDRLVALTFRRYARLTLEVVEWFASAGATTVVITDDALAPATARASHVIVCASHSAGPFPSSASALFVVEALAATVASRQRDGDRLEAAGELLDRFGPY